MNDKSLGLGLLSIGRPWGQYMTPPPSESKAIELIHHAHQNGINFFDTAPAYAKSEKILGAALSRMRSIEGITISTKMGEYWNNEEETSYSNHHYSHLAAGIEKSLNNLGRIDLLQLHKANENNILSTDVIRAIEYAKNNEVSKIGASVSDASTAELACKSGMYDYIQFPFNKKNTLFQKIFPIARNRKVKIIINRPFAMGSLITDEISTDALFSFILKKEFSGIILTGTASLDHLIQNINSFKTAKKTCGLHSDLQQE